MLLLKKLSNYLQCQGDIKIDCSIIRVRDCSIRVSRSCATNIGQKVGGMGPPGLPVSTALLITDYIY